MESTARKLFSSVATRGVIAGVDLAGPIAGATPIGGVSVDRRTSGNASGFSVVNLGSVVGSNWHRLGIPLRLPAHLCGSLIQLADSRADCTQTKDPQRTIRGCAHPLMSGRRSDNRVNWPPFNSTRPSCQCSHFPGGFPCPSFEGGRKAGMAGKSHKERKVL